MAVKPAPLPDSTNRSTKSPQSFTITTTWSKPATHRDKNGLYLQKNTTMKIITTHTATIGQQIRMAMNEKEASINKLVEATGIANTTIMRILNDKEYNINSLKKIVKYLGIPIHIYPYCE